MDQSMLKKIKKALMSGSGYVRIGHHTKKRMFDRGYSKGDMVSAVMKGKVIEIQYGHNRSLGHSTFNFVIEGSDLSGNPIVVILSQEAINKYLVVTVMPPIDKKRFNKVI